MAEDNNEELIKQLNDFLKGINMGSDAFTDYLEKTENLDLKHKFKKIISTFASHKKIVTSYIEKLGGEPKESIGITGGVATIFEKMKEIFMDKDDEILNAAVKAMDMGVQGGSKVIEQLEHMDIKHSIFTSLKDMIKEYETIYNNLNLLYKKTSIKD